MHDVDAFLTGIKPALYGNTGSPTLMEHLDKLLPYPCVTDNIDIFDGKDFFLFFQNEKLKQDFLSQLSHVKSRSPQFHQLLGNALGYPPLATQFYASCQEKEQLYDYSLGILYAGIRCISHVEEVESNCIWLWDRYTDDIDLRIQINGNHYPVKQHDTEELENIIQVHYQQQTTAII
jgi:hypothetical protein